ncbi:LuxR C-terminal-related transcriptional regulator [Serratia fonticola]|uniref:helix-turn-helix transcriptional regulator n=1 Tax=Serratia fonticola TaxID=47917 RepID=UPI003AAD9B9C
MMITADISDSVPLSRPEKGYNLGNIVLMERCPMIQIEIKRLLAQPCFQVKHYQEASSIADVPRTITQYRADLVIMELAGKGESVLESLRIVNQILAAKRKIPLIVCTSLADTRLLKQLLSLGVNGIYHKQDPLSALSQCIVQVMNKRRGISPQAANLLKGLVGTTPLLTSREIDVLEALSSGKSLTKIAHTLCRDIRTISTHKCSAMHKLGFHNNGELYSWLVQLQQNNTISLISPRDSLEPMRQEMVPALVGGNGCNSVVPQQKREIGFDMDILTLCERKVLLQLLAGLSPTEIAALFHRSIKTISAHKCNGMRKLGMGSDVELFQLSPANTVLTNSLPG